MNDTSLKILKDEIGAGIDAVSKVMSRAESAALRKGAQLLKKNTKSNLTSTGIRIGINPLYIDKLSDGVMSSKVKEGSIVVHVMGTRKKGSGTFRLRFFEGGTKERYQKTWKGKKLRVPRRLGHIKAYGFFNSALSSSTDEVMKAMDEQLTKYIEKAWNNG